MLGLRKYGKTLTAHLDSLGMLGPHLSAAHAIWLDRDDLGRLADNGASVVHAPVSNMRFGSGPGAFAADARSRHQCRHCHRRRQQF